MAASVGALVAFGTTAVPATALAAEASATLTGVKILAIDLDPTDGIAAGFSFSAQSKINSYAFADQVGTWLPTTPRDFYSSAQLDFSSQGGKAGASILQGNGGFRSFANLADSAVGRADSQSAAEDNGFRIAPHTQIKLVGDWSLATKVAPNCASCLAISSVSAAFYTPADPPVTWLLQYQQLAESLAGKPLPGTDPHGFPATRSGQFDLSFSNTGAESMTGFFSMGTGATVQAAAPIPEPQTYALMAVGLLVVGGAVRGRRAARVDGRTG